MKGHATDVLEAEKEHFSASYQKKKKKGKKSQNQLPQYLIPA